MAAPQNVEMIQSVAMAAMERLPPAQGDEIIDLKTAARLLGYSKSHLSKIIAGKFPDLPTLRHVRVGRTIRLRRGAVLEWFRLAENGNRGRDEKC
jgi:excisionase family DNA binding protein